MRAELEQGVMTQQKACAWPCCAICQSAPGTNGRRAGRAGCCVVLQRLAQQLAIHREYHCLHSAWVLIRIRRDRGVPFEVNRLSKPQQCPLRTVLVTSHVAGARGVATRGSSSTGVNATRSWPIFRRNSAASKTRSRIVVLVSYGSVGRGRSPECFKNSRDWHWGSERPTSLLSSRLKRYMQL